MRKLMTVCALLVLCGSAKAQVETDRYNTYSPYSIFGVGENSFSWGTGETQSMAGVGVSWMPAGVNNAINPASLASIRQTAYTVGASLDMSWYEDAKNSNQHKDIYFDYLVFSVPLTRTSGVSLGVTPYSTTGYSIYDRDSMVVDGSYKETLGYYDGNGGLTQVYLAYGRQIFRNFNLGVSAAYLFGTIKRTTYNTLEDRLLQNKTTESNWVTGFKFRVGFNYSLPLVDQTRLYLGGVYDFSSAMNNDRTYRNYVVEDYNTAFDPDNPENTEEDTSDKFHLPWNVTGGIGVGNLQKWYVGLDVQYTSKPDYGSVDFLRGPAEYQSGKRIALGGSYTPMYNSPDSYFQRVRYQGGVYYRQLEYKLFGQQINDMGITLGASLPVTKVSTQAMSVSNLNVFLNVGMMGKSSDRLTKETYFKLGLSFSLNDRWFIKRQYF